MVAIAIAIAIGRSGAAARLFQGKPLREQSL
jgi:hypothetical protein